MHALAHACGMLNNDKCSSGTGAAQAPALGISGFGGTNIWEQNI